jgi:hypothetical protein
MAKESSKAVKILCNEHTGARTCNETENRMNDLFIALFTRNTGTHSR